MKDWQKGLLCGVGIIIAAITYLNKGTVLAHLTTKFRFEKYKTAELAKAELLNLHPVGSPVEEVIETLENAGAKRYNPIISKKYQDDPRLKDMLFFRYFSGMLGFVDWDISVETDSFQKVIEIKVTRLYDGS